MATKRKPAAAKKMIADSAELVSQKRMILDLMLGGVKVFLTPEGKALLWGDVKGREKTSGGGMKLTYQNTVAAREVG